MPYSSEKLLPPEVGDNADTPLFPDSDSDPPNQ